MSSLVSVVIPTFNYGRFLGQAIESVLSQTYSPIECIVVDNGSTDNTPTVLAGYQGRVQVITQANLGPSVARNTGISAASGDYVAFLDADDWWERNKVAIQMRFLELNTQIDAVGCGERHVNEDGRVITESIPTPLTNDKEENVRAVAIRRRWVAGTTSGVLMRKRVFESIGVFDENLIGAEDYDMWLRLVSQHQVHNLPDILLNRRIHNGGFARNAAMLEERAWHVYRKAIKQWPVILDKRLRRQMRALILADSGDEYNGASNWEMAIRRYISSLREWPFDSRRWKVLVVVTIKSWGYKRSSSGTHSR